jgi:hypothetical protein
MTQSEQNYEQVKAALERLLQTDWGINLGMNGLAALERMRQQNERLMKALRACWGKHADIDSIVNAALADTPEVPSA